MTYKIIFLVIIICLAISSRAESLLDQSYAQKIKQLNQLFLSIQDEIEQTNILAKNKTIDFREFTNRYLQYASDIKNLEKQLGKITPSASAKELHNYLLLTYRHYAISLECISQGLQKQNRSIIMQAKEHLEKSRQSVEKFGHLLQKEQNAPLIPFPAEVSVLKEVEPLLDLAVKKQPSVKSFYVSTMGRFKAVSLEGWKKNYPSLTQAFNGEYIVWQKEDILISVIGFKLTSLVTFEKITTALGFKNSSSCQNVKVQQLSGNKLIYLKDETKSLVFCLTNKDKSYGYVLVFTAKNDAFLQKEKVFEKFLDSFRVL